jgi:MFS-type transporter involved in bile tolerance (Atg22 family)
LALPPKTNYFTVGIKNSWVALKEIRHLTQAALYLAAFFIITDTITTLTTVVSISQNTIM